MTRQSELNATYELVQREQAYLLEAYRSGQFDQERWKDFIAFADKSGCRIDADAMRRLFVKYKSQPKRIAMNASVQDALELIPEAQRDIVLKEAKHLMDEVKGLGYIGALILLASVSEYVGKE